MFDYMVYWNKTENGFKYYEQALKFAMDCTRGDEVNKEAVIINRRHYDNIEMLGVRWIFEDLFEFTQLDI